MVHQTRKTPIGVFFVLYLLLQGTAPLCHTDVPLLGAFCVIWRFSLCSATRDEKYKDGYTAGYEAGYNDGKQQATGNQKSFARFSGSFTATVEQLLPDFYALPGKTIAVVYFFKTDHFYFFFKMI